MLRNEHYKLHYKSVVFVHQWVFIESAVPVYNAVFTDGKGTVPMRHFLHTSCMLSHCITLFANIDALGSDDYQTGTDRKRICEFVCINLHWHWFSLITKSNITASWYVKNWTIMWENTRRCPDIVLPIWWLVLSYWNELIGQSTESTTHLGLIATCNDVMGMNHSGYGELLTRICPW